MEAEHTPALLAALASELASVRAGIDGLAEIVSAHVQVCPPEERARVLRDGQAIDVLTQRLEALHVFTRSLSAGVSIDAALGAVHLADVAERLRMSLYATSPSCTAKADAGELDLF